MLSSFMHLNLLDSVIKLQSSFICVCHNTVAARFFTENVEFQ